MFLSLTSHQSLRAWQLLAIFGLAVAARWGFLVMQGLGGEPSTLALPDEQQYWLMAQALRDGEPMADELGFVATRMPLFPSFLALFPGTNAGVIAARIVLAAIGSLAALLTALLAGRVIGPSAGLLAGLLVAFDPALVGLSSLLLTEAPFVVAVVALWLVGWPLGKADTHRNDWPRWLKVGLLAALTVYLRPSGILLIGGWLIFLMIRRGLRRWRTWLGAAMVAAIVLLSLTPWAWRNWRLTADWCWLTHRMGISLYDGVGPQATGASSLSNIKNMPAVADLDETAWNRWFVEQSFASIRHDPGRIVRLAVVKLGRTWRPWPVAEDFSSPAVRLVFAAWSIPFFALAIAGLVLLWRRHRAVCIAVLIPVLYVCVLHSVFVGSLRYRVVTTPLLAIAVASALVTIGRRWRSQDHPDHT